MFCYYKYIKASCNLLNRGQTFYFPRLGIYPESDTFFMVILSFMVLLLCTWSYIYNFFCLVSVEEM